MPLKIGHHPNNLHLALAAKLPGAFSGFDAEFVAYEEGRDTAELLASGTIDFGGTGSTPPIVAQADGRTVGYIAASAQRPANGAILVMKDSAIDTIAGLKARKIALVDGSFLTYFLAKSLEDAGLSLRDVVRNDVSPAMSAKLLRTGEAQAWIAMAPHLEEALNSGEFKVLALCGTTIPNRSTFWTIAERGLSAETIAAIAGELARIGAEISADPARAASFLADDENSRRAWTRIISQRDWRVFPADDTILAEQQAEADTLHRHGDLDKRLSIKKEETV